MMVLPLFDVILHYFVKKYNYIEKDVNLHFVLGTHFNRNIFSHIHFIFTVLVSYPFVCAAIVVQVVVFGGEDG